MKIGSRPSNERVLKQKLMFYSDSGCLWAERCFEIAAKRRVMTVFNVEPFFYHIGLLMNSARIT